MFHSFMRLTVAVIVVAAFLGCDVDFKEAVDCPPSAAVDPAPYLGRWQVATMAKQAVDAGTVVDIQQRADGSLKADVTEGQKTVEVNLRLTNIGGRIVASMHDVGEEVPNWDVFQMVLSNDAATLTLLLPDQAAIQADVEAETLAGSVTERDPENDLVAVTATAAVLRTYIADHEDFFAGEGATLARLQD